LANLNAKAENYHGDDASFAVSALVSYDVKDTLDWFSQMGLYTVAEDSGRVYPYSDQANSVVDVLRFALNRPEITLLPGVEVKKIRKTDTGFRVEAGEDSWECDRLIIACGGLAGSKLGGSMAGYQLLRSMGHHVTKLRPTLVQLKSDWSGCASLKGVRANCLAVILHDGSVHSESRGELQFTEYGLSGPVIFEVSRDACQGSGKWWCRLDFLPELSEDELEKMLLQRCKTELTCEDLLTGILHNRLGRVLVQAAGIAGYVPVRQLDAGEIREICHRVKHFEVALTEPMGMDSAQVTAGGIMTEEFDPETMESRLVSGLYACGEVLDIDGDCGGYNLQWAWSSGRLAGKSAAEK
jgi:predicted Rossmann fold flavoprotein